MAIDYVELVTDSPDNLTTPDDDRSPTALLAEAVGELKKSILALENDLSDLTYRFNQWTDTTS